MCWSLARLNHFPINTQPLVGEGALGGVNTVCMLFYGQVVTNIDIMGQNSSAGGCVREQSGVTVNQLNNVSLGGTIQTNREIC